MKAGKPVGFILVLSVLAIAGGGVLVSQRQQAALLHIERQTLQFQLRELDTLRAENNRLSAQQISASELETLRADHVAISRLRAELDGLNKAR